MLFRFTKTPPQYAWILRGCFYCQQYKLRILFLTQLGFQVAITSIILKPPVSTGGLNKPTNHIYHLFINITSQVKFMKR
jgi:hypothetical protein